VDTRLLLDDVLLQSLPVAAVVSLVIGAYIVVIVVMLAVRSVLIVSISSTQPLSSSFSLSVYVSLISISPEWQLHLSSV